MRLLHCLMVVGLLAPNVVLAQNASPPSASGAAVASAGLGLAGKWTYRSFHNNPEQVTSDPGTAADKALALIFAEAVFTFEAPFGTTVKGAIDWQGGGLDLQGTIQTDAGDFHGDNRRHGAPRHGNGRLGIQLSWSARLSMAERGQSGPVARGQRDPR